MGVDFLRGSVGNPPVVEAVSSGTAVAAVSGGAGLLGSRWCPSGFPASHNQRGRSRVVGRTATTLIARRRPTSYTWQLERIALSEGARYVIVRGATCSREVDKHNGVPGTPEVAPYFRVNSSRVTKSTDEGGPWLHVQALRASALSAVSPCDGAMAQ